MTNVTVAEQFDALADIVEKSSDNVDRFRVAAYRKTAAKLRKTTTDLSQLTAKELQALGFGKSSAEKIVESFRAGTIRKLTTLRKPRIPDYDTAEPEDMLPWQQLIPVRAVLRDNDARFNVYRGKSGEAIIYAVVPQHNAVRMCNMLRGVMFVDTNANNRVFGKSLSRRTLVYWRNSEAVR